jgi:hypothetical protein
VARAVKVTQVDTPYFTILPPPNAFQKVAPGVALVFRIQFKPEEQRVYFLTSRGLSINNFSLGLHT